MDDTAAPARRFLALELALGFEEQQQFAEALGVPSGNMGHYQRGRNEVPPRLLRRLQSKFPGTAAYVAFDDWTNIKPDLRPKLTAAEKAVENWEKAGKPNKIRDWIKKNAQASFAFLRGDDLRLPKAEPPE